VGATGQHQSMISALDELDALADGADRDTLAGSAAGWRTAG
jgi:hypothetical protein